MALAKGSMDASQAEFAQLQREYRHMELNRKSYADESYGVLRKQQATIQKLGGTTSVSRVSWRPRHGRPQKARTV